MLCAANISKKIFTTSDLCSSLLELGRVVVGLLFVAADLEQVGEHRPLREEIKNLQASKAEAACLREMNVKRRERAGSKSKRLNMPCAWMVQCTISIKFQPPSLGRDYRCPEGGLSFVCLELECLPRSLTMEAFSRRSTVAEATIEASTKGRSRRPYSLIDPCGCTVTRAWR